MLKIKNLLIKRFNIVLLVSAFCLVGCSQKPETKKQPKTSQKVATDTISNCYIIDKLNVKHVPEELFMKIGKNEHIEKIYKTRTLIAIHTNQRNVFTLMNEKYDSSEITFSKKRSNITHLSLKDNVFMATTDEGKTLFWDKYDHNIHIPSDIQSKIVQIYPLWKGYLARTDQGKIISWGTEESVLKIPKEVINALNTKENGKVLQVISNTKAAVVLTDKHKVFAWGDNSHGGNIPKNIQNMIKNKNKYGGIIKVYTDDSYITPDFNAVVALTDAGKLFSWGSKIPRFGGLLPDAISNPNNNYTVVKLYEKTRDLEQGLIFIALTSEGKVYAWGDPHVGGKIPKETQIEMDKEKITKLYVSKSPYGAYAALSELGKVFVWNDHTLDITPNQELYNTEKNGKVTSISINSSSLSYDAAFAALTDKGKVYRWGTSQWGAEAPPGINNSKLHGKVIALYNNSDPEDQILGGAFLAITSTGKFISWGYIDSGGEIPKSIQKIFDNKTQGEIIKIVHNGFAFAVLTDSGKVLTWGNASRGGTIPADIKTQMRKHKIIEIIKEDNNKFIALTEDGKSFAWGGYITCKYNKKTQNQSQ
jgi:alpha-tubulin suppressor-like RCC1 family protein